MDPATTRRADLNVEILRHLRWRGLDPEYGAVRLSRHGGLRSGLRAQRGLSDRLDPGLQWIHVATREEMAEEAQAAGLKLVDWVPDPRTVAVLQHA